MPNGAQNFGTVSPCYTARPCHPLQRQKKLQAFSYSVHWSRPASDRRPNMKIAWTEDWTDKPRTGPVLDRITFTPTYHMPFSLLKVKRHTIMLIWHCLHIKRQLLPFFGHPKPTLISIYQVMALYSIGVTFNEL